MWFKMLLVKQKGTTLTSLVAEKSHFLTTEDVDLDKHPTLYEPFDNSGSTTNGLGLNMESALTNEAKKREQTFGLQERLECTRTRLCVWCAVPVWVQSRGCGGVCSAVTGIQRALDTIASLVSNLSLLVPRKVHACVWKCVCVCMHKAQWVILAIPPRSLKMATGKWSRGSCDLLPRVVHMVWI